jgi:hypothetical protein
MPTNLDQATKDFYLRSYITRGHDYVPDWVNVSRLLRRGANPHARVPSFAWTSVEHCQAMLNLEHIDTQSQKLFRGYLAQFRKYGFIQ